MSKKAIIWRSVLGAVILIAVVLLGVLIIKGLKSCEKVNNGNYQESTTNELESELSSELESEIDSESKSEPESESQLESNKETIQIQKAEGMIMELNKPSEDRPYYLFKLKDSDNWYRFLVVQSDNNPVIPKLRMEVSIEYIESEEEGIYIIQKIQVLDSEEETNKNPKVEGIITEFQQKPSENHNYYLFKLEGSDDLYKFRSSDSTWLEVGMQVSVEYLEPAVEGVYIVLGIQKISF